MACGLDPRNTELASEVRLYHITYFAASKAVVCRPNGRQRRHTQHRCSLRQRQNTHVFAEPHRLVSQDERDHRDIRSTRNLERRAPEAMQAVVRRARAFRKNQHAQPFADALYAGRDDVAAVVRAARALEQTRAFEQWPPPAAAEQRRLHGRGDVANRRHQRGDVQKTRMIADQHGRSVGDLAAQLARVEVEQTRPAQHVVHEPEVPAHHTL